MKSYKYGFIIICIVAIIAIFTAILSTVTNPPPAHAASQFATILCDKFTPISQAATTTQLVTAGNGNMFIYVCSYNLAAGTADNFSFIEGTGATCGTNTLAVVGSTTAANGINMAANGNINFGGGSGAVAKTAVAGDNLCLVSSTAGPLAGVIGTTQQPF